MTCPEMTEVSKNPVKLQYFLERSYAVIVVLQKCRNFNNIHKIHEIISEKDAFLQ